MQTIVNDIAEKNPNNKKNQKIPTTDLFSPTKKIHLFIKQFLNQFSSCISISFPHGYRNKESPTSAKQKLHFRQVSIHFKLHA